MATVEIPLTRGYAALIDEADLPLVSGHKWYAQGAPPFVRACYYTRGGKRHRRCVYMHRVILGLDPDDRTVVDHANHNTLDNRRANLRECRPRQNSWNSRRRRSTSSGFIGVVWREGGHAYQARIRISGGEKHLGYFKDPVEAARTYDRAARRIRGPFAVVNFP